MKSSILRLENLFFVDVKKLFDEKLAFGFRQQSDLDFFSVSLEMEHQKKYEEEKTVVQQENDITTSKVERMCRE